MRKIMLTLSALCILLANALSQRISVTGTVKDELGNPLSNASVTVKGTQLGTTTNDAGFYSLALPTTAQTLVFSSVATDSAEVEINNRSVIDIILNIKATVLTAIVLTPYGATQKKSFTGTASTIKQESFKDLQVSSVTGVLQGNASGVLAVSSNGQPGESPDIRIRGIGSVNASAEPLIVVDGAPYGADINSINPNDVETITILKDASSTALYGSRAANGVIQITTKTGGGKSAISLSALTGFSDRAVADYAYVDSRQLYEWTWEALKNEAALNPGLVSASGAVSAQDYASKQVVGILVYNPFGLSQPIGNDGKLRSDAQNLWNQDWADALLRTGLRNDYNLSISGGSLRTKYYISGGYLQDQGVAIESKFQRYTGRLKIDTKVNEWLDAGLSTNVVYSTQNYPAQGGSAYSNVIGWIRSVSGIYPEFLRDPASGQFILNGNGEKQFDFGNNGPLVRPLLTPANPAGTTVLNPTTYDRYVTSANGFLEAKIYKGLKLRSQYAIDLYQFAEDTYFNPFIGDGAAYKGRGYRSRSQQTTQTFTSTLTYDKAFGDHHLNLLGGMEAYRFHQGFVGAEARGFTFPGVSELDYASTPYATNSYSFDDRLVSYFTRVNYDLTEKYHLSLSLRSDGSSRFADSSRWGIFYSIGGAWNLDKEKMLSGIDWLSNLKLRSSYGTAGNRALLDNDGNPAYFPYLGTYSAGANIAGYSGSIVSQLANGKLHWESQQTLDLGIDFGFFKDRISGSFTYFERKSADLLFNRPLPPSVGFEGINDNIAKVSNSGIEFDLLTKNIQRRNFTWATSFNITHVENKIVAIPQESIAGGGFSNLKVGESLYNFYLREYAGVDAANGTPLWYKDEVDASGKVTGKTVTKRYSEATRYYLGTALPKWTGGVTSSIYYKNLDLSLLTSFSIGGMVYDGDYASLMHGNTGTSPGNNWSTDVLKRWQSPSNPGDGRTPRLTTTTDDQGNLSSSRFLYNASYARIRNFTVGYNFSRRLLDGIKFSSARFYIDVQNPFTFFGRDGLDPEVGLGGITDNTSSAYKTVSLGLNLGF